MRLWAPGHVRLIARSITLPLKTTKLEGKFFGGFFWDVMCNTCTVPSCRSNLSALFCGVNSWLVSDTGIQVYRSPWHVYPYSYMEIVIIGYLIIFIDDWVYIDPFRDKLPLYLGWRIAGAFSKTIYKFWSNLRFSACCHASGCAMRIKPWLETLQCLCTSLPRHLSCWRHWLRRRQTFENRWRMHLA